jgi:hypothetical protein
MEILKKISVKTCNAHPAMEIVKVDGKDVTRAKGKQSLLRILGMSNDIKRGTGDYGPWVAFVGAFEATNLVSGEVFQSSICLLPESAAGLLSVAVSKEAGKTVEFALDIGVEPANNPMGFQYTIKPLMESDETDPLRHLKNNITAKHPLQIGGKTAPEKKAK